MTRLIDADALLEDLSIHLIRSGSVLFSNDVLTLITNAPTVQREGWVSVPIEPTVEMIQAASNYWKKAPDNTYGFVLFENVYEVMIQAAPTDKE